MGRIRQVLAALVVVTALASTADALTVRDIIELSKAGLGDDVLLALIEVDRSVFSIDTATLKMLKTSGVSEAVIVAMVRSGRMPVADAPAPPAPETDPAPVVTPEPQVIVIDHHDPVQVPVAVPVAYPVFVSIPRRQPHLIPPSPNLPNGDRRPGNDLSPRNSDLSPQPTKPRGSSCPVYWGFGGKLRPGSWQPAPGC